MVLEPVPVSIPNLEQQKKISYNDLLFRTIEASPEKKQYDFILRVIPLIKRENNFSILGGSSFSRGVAGGVFDKLPQTDGLGFDHASVQRIVDAESDILKNQQRGIIETLKRQLRRVVENWNGLVDSSVDYRRKAELSEANVNDLKDHMWMGERGDLMDFANALHEKNIAQSIFLEKRYDFLIGEDSLKRLLFNGPYDMTVSTIGGEKK